jgi:hypothetical protein
MPATALDLLLAATAGAFSVLSVTSFLRLARAATTVSHYPQYHKDLRRIILVGTLLLLLVLPYAQTPSPTPGLYTGPFPVWKTDNTPIPGEENTQNQNLLRNPMPTYTGQGDTSNNPRTYTFGQFSTPESRHTYTFPHPSAGSNVVFSDDFVNQTQDSNTWVRYYGQPKYFTKPEYVTTDSFFPYGFPWNPASQYFDTISSLWNGTGLSYPYPAFSERTFNRTPEGILRLDPYHFAQSQPWDTYFGNYSYYALNSRSIIARSPLDYNWFSDFNATNDMGTSRFDYMYVLNRELPTNFEFSFTLIRQGSWGGISLVLGKDPHHIPDNFDQGSYFFRTGNSNDGPNTDYFPIAVEDQPCAIAYIGNAQASQTYATSYETIARWKNKGFLRPLFVANGSNTTGTNKGWNPNIVLQSRAQANGTANPLYADSGSLGYGHGWPYLYSLKPGIPYRVTMARINGVIYLRVVNIDPNADPSDWIAYKSTVKDANAIGASSGNSPTLPLSADTLPAAAGQRLYLWCQDWTTNYGQSASGRNTLQYIQSGESQYPCTKYQEETFGGAIDDVVLRTVTSESDLTPLPNATAPAITATPIATRGTHANYVDGLPGSTHSYGPNNVTYVTYRINNPTATTATNIQFYGEGVTIVDQSGDLQLEGQPTQQYGDTLANVLYDTRPFALGRNTGTNGGDNAAVLAYVATLAPGQTRDVTIGYLTGTTWQVADNARVYLTVGPQNTRVATVSNDWLDPDAPTTVNNLYPYLSPGSNVPAKPGPLYDGVTGPYGFADWQWNNEGAWVKIPYPFAAEPASQPNGSWVPVLQYKYSVNGQWYDYTTTDTLVSYYIQNLDANYGANKKLTDTRGIWRFVGDGSTPTPSPSPGGSTPAGAADSPTAFSPLVKIQSAGAKFKAIFQVVDPDGIATVSVKGPGIKPTMAHKKGARYMAVIPTRPKALVISVTDRNGNRAMKRVKAK